MSTKKLCSIILVCPLDSTLTAEDMIIISCLRVFSLFLAFLEHWLWTQGLEGAVIASEVNGLSKNRIVGAVVHEYSCFIINKMDLLL